MRSAKPQPSAPKLSICIATFNRASFIGATLESILAQATDDCEVVVLDGASIDDTERVVSDYRRRFDRLRYIRQDTNNGIDRDYDRVVGLARGEYCWLMTDDDLLKPMAVAAVLKALRPDVNLVIVNAEVWDFNMSKLLQRRWLDFESDREYGPGEMDRLFVDVGDVLKYIGGVIIKRALWLERERQRYYDSSFVYVGVIFQAPLPGQALVIAEPVISYRTGNSHTFSPQVNEIIWIKWPSLVGSLALSESAKSKVGSAEPWRNPQWLLLLRGSGFYSLNEYRQWIRPRTRSMCAAMTPALIALLPGPLVNSLFVFYYSVTAWHPRGVWLQGMRESRFHYRKWGIFKSKAKNGDNSE